MLKPKRKPKLVPKVDKEFAALIAPLSAEERQQLEANLIAHGCRDALVVWRGLLLDGHNRLEICNRHGLAYETTEIDLPDLTVRQKSQWYMGATKIKARHASGSVRRESFKSRLENFVRLLRLPRWMPILSTALPMERFRSVMRRKP
jgi:hypothetical protein